MQFQVPQFIDTEDKIVGPLSLRQFAFIAVGAILSAILYFVAEPWLWALGSIFILGAAIALAFVKIEGRPFMNVLIAAFNFYWKPQTYIWQAEHPKARVSEEKVKAEAGKSALEEILAKSAEKVRSATTATKQEVSRAAKVFSAPAAVVAKPITRETVSAGSALHKSWEDLQTGAPLTQKARTNNSSTRKWPSATRSSNEFPATATRRSG